MPGPDIRLNSQLYSLSTREDGTKIVTRPVQQFVQSIKDTGRTRPEDVSPYETFIHPNLTYGFGRYRINSDAAFSGKEYRRCWDSTCETRWPDAVYLPILSEDTTQTNIDVARASAEFKAETHLLGEDLVSAGVSHAVARQFSGGSDTWEPSSSAEPKHEYGTVNPILTGNTALNNAVGTTAIPVYGTNTLLVVLLNGSDDSSGNISDPSTITYAGSALTKLSSTGGSGDQYVGIYYKEGISAGTNNLVIAWTDGGGGGVARPYGSAMTFQGVDQTTPISLVSSLNGTASSHTTSVTSVAGDVVISGVQVEGTTITIPSDHTELFNAQAASTFTHVNTYEVATTTTTTMDYTFGDSGSYKHITAIINPSLTTVALDIIQHKTNLVALVAHQDDHETWTSSDGLDWSVSTTPITAGLLDDTAVSANEDIDAGLLATTGLGELCAVVWHEDSSTITFFSSTDAGVTWADESLEIASSGGPKGVVAYPDIDRTTKLYVATTEGIHVVDTSVSTWTTSFIHPMTPHANNGRRMVVHGGAIWFAQGVDADTPAPIYRLTVSGDRRSIESGYGLNQGDGVPSEMLGSINYMKSSGDFLFASVGGHDGDGNRFSRIICHNGLGWHHMTEYQTTDKPIEYIGIGAGDDSTPRLHYAVRTASTTSDLKFLEQPLVNPRSGVTIKREDDSSGVTGYVDLPYIDLGMPHESKNFLRAHVNGEDLNSSASDEYITVQYGTDDAARTATTLGSFTSATTVNTFQSNAGESAKNIGMRVNLLRGSTNTNTPILKDLIVEGMVVPGNGNLMYQHEMIIDIDQTADMLGLNTETVYSNLKTLLATVTQVDLEFGSESRKVTVDRESSQFHTYLDGEASSSAPNGLAIRKGKLRLILTERIPLS